MEVNQRFSFGLDLIREAGELALGSSTRAAT